jgi:hypothetical protein
MRRKAEKTFSLKPLKDHACLEAFKTFMDAIYNKSDYADSPCVAAKTFCVAAYIIQGDQTRL